MLVDESLDYIDHYPQRKQDERDATRYRAIVSSGLPVTFRGIEYRDKASIDAAIGEGFSEVKP